MVSAQNVPNLVAIDGCPVGRAMRLLKHAEIPVSSYLVVQDLGIEKTMDNFFHASEVEKVKAAVKGACNSIVSPVADKEASGRSSCCG